MKFCWILLISSTKLQNLSTLPYNIVSFIMCKYQPVDVESVNYLEKICHSIANSDMFDQANPTS